MLSMQSSVVAMCVNVCVCVCKGSFVCVGSEADSLNPLVAGAKSGSEISIFRVTQNK